MPFVIPAVIAAYVAVSAAVAAVSAITIAGVSLTTILINVALSVGLSLLAAALAPSPHYAEQRDVIRQALALRERCYGRVKKGGCWSFLQQRDGTLYQQILVNSGLVDGFETHYFGQDVLTVDGSGNVTVPTRFYYKEGMYWAQVFTHEGTSTQSADPILIAEFPDCYTTDMRCLGIAYVTIVLISPSVKYFTSTYPTGLPQWNGVLRGAQVFDPRDGTQSYANPASWKWTMNGVLIVMDYLTHNDGARLPFALIEPALGVWAAQAAIADTNVPLQDGGSEPAFQLSGVYHFTDAVKQVLPLMLDPMDARLGLRPDGAIVLDVGQWQEPLDAIADQDIISYTSFSKGFQRADIKNEIRAQFVSPDYNFVEQEMDPWLNEASIDVDGLITAQLDLGWAPSHRQARVRAKIESFRQDPNSWVGTIVTNFEGLIFLELRADGTKKRTMNFSISELGIDRESFEVKRFAFNPKNWQCTFTVASMSSAAYAWNPDTDEGVAPGLPAAIAASTVENPSSMTVTVTGNGLTVTVVPPISADGDTLNLVLEYRVHDLAIADIDATWFDFALDGWGGSAVTGGGDFDVRCAFEYTDGLISDYLYERGFVVGGTAPGVPVNVTATASGATAVIQFNAPNSTNFSYGTVWRNSTNTFASSTNISTDINGAPNELLSWDDVPGTGTWYYWVTASDAGGDTSAAVASTPSSLTF